MEFYLYNMAVILIKGETMYLVNKETLESLSEEETKLLKKCGTDLSITGEKGKWGLWEISFKKFGDMMYHAGCCGERAAFDFRRCPGCGAQMKNAT